MLQVNLNTVFTLCRDVGAHMLAREPDSTGRRGAIINIASLLSFQGGLTVPAYAASKGGVAQLTKALSNEWASKGIQVNAIAPGYIATEMNTALINDKTRAEQIMARIPAGRWGKPDDFKGPIVFLASRAAAYVSGEIHTVDGGWMYDSPLLQLLDDLLTCLGDDDFTINMSRTPHFKPVICLISIQLLQICQLSTTHYTKNESMTNLYALITIPNCKYHFILTPLNMPDTYLNSRVCSPHLSLSHT